MSHPGQRLWRLRKRHHYVDAELRVEGSQVEIQFFLDGQSNHRRLCATRDEAMAEAASRRAELEREGWMFHW